MELISDPKVRAGALEALVYGLLDPAGRLGDGFAYWVGSVYRMDLSETIGPFDRLMFSMGKDDRILVYGEKDGLID